MQRLDKLINSSRNHVKNGNTILCYGALIMIVSLTLQFTSSGEYGFSLGAIGMITGYVGVSLVILAEHNISRKNKIIRIISLPVLVVILGSLELLR